jgi:hypothetical protein
MTALSLRCACGAVQGSARDISPTTSANMVCYCVDCQAYARFLERDGLVDAHGGTNVFLAAPANVSFSQGAEQLACLRLSEKGLFRWYAKCCRTPVGNVTGSSLLPMIMVPVAFVDRSVVSAEQLLGKSIGIMGSAARGGVPPGVHPKLPAGPIAGMLWRIAKAKLAGKGKPSPFFDPQTQRPRAKAQVLTKEERAALG